MTWLDVYKNKYVAPSDVESWAEEIRYSGSSIATINGSFDLLHAGHLHILFEASQQADVLIVALNSDRSIQSYKSRIRPIVPLDYRLQMVAAVGFVDFVTSFEELDPRALLSKICPDVHVNGTEYGKDCVEAETVRRAGGRIHIVDLKPGLSTSKIIEKIQSTCV